MFLGTSEFAVPSLRSIARLADRGEVDVAGVVTRPDRPADRGRVAAPAVKEAAARLGLRVLQPERLRGEALEEILRLGPEVLVWAAYGALIPGSLIAAANGRAVNVHASLLPRWRGASPVAQAILAGDEMTGVTLMQGTADLDAGPILAQESTPVAGTESRGELEARLARVGAELLERELPRYLRGELVAAAQDETRVTWAPKLDPRGGELDLRRSAEALARSVRAYTPDPGAYTFYKGTRLGVLRASVEGGAPAEQGTVSIRGGAPLVATGAGWLRLEEVRLAGKRSMSGADWARGRRDLDGTRLPS